MDSSADTTRKRKKLRPFAVLFLLFISVGAIGCSIFFYTKYQSSQQSETAERAKALKHIGTVIDLPKDEPTVVTVVDKNKLGNQTLAARVNNDDILFIFGQAKRIIIYRPSAQKVMDMLTFANKNELPQSQKSATPKQ
jgi:hypothetical protein